MNKKKSYAAPEMKIYQMQQANVIATSGGTMSVFGTSSTHTEGGIEGGNGGDSL